jgi:hypothetical protein
MKMRATDNLSQRSSRMVNCIVTRKLPIWDAQNGWSNLQPTQSIAWAMADILKASYGAKLDDNRIDLQALVVLDGVWQARGDTFNGVFDSVLMICVFRAFQCKSFHALAELSLVFVRIARTS